MLIDSLPGISNFVDQKFFFGNAGAVGNALGEIDSGHGSYFKLIGLSSVLTLQLGVTALSIEQGGGALLEGGGAGSQIALGKFNVISGGDSVASLRPFAEGLSQNLGETVTSWYDWSMKGFSSPEAMITHMMEGADTIHFNMQGVDAAKALSGLGGIPTAEWELQQIFQRGWVGKTIFYF